MLQREGWLIGLMSGTSADGIDAALLWTDGEAILRPGLFLYRPYDSDFRARLMACYGSKMDNERGDIAAIERKLTLRHAAAIEDLLRLSGLSANDILAVGFHGQTIFHAPSEGKTWQLGDGALLANLTGIDVINDFRSADVAGGGEGAPLVPVFHRALAQGFASNFALPVAFLNIGGVANVTWIGNGEEILAFDTGPGNALIDDSMRQHFGVDFDKDGDIALSGQVCAHTLAMLLAHSYFGKPPPKSLDRDHFRAFAMEAIASLSPQDRIATLTSFTAESIARACDHFPAKPNLWFIGGGGRKNPALMQWLGERLAAPLKDIADLGWDGDALEAMAFAYLAMRSLKGLPLSYPMTTGVAAPQKGGRHHQRPLDLSK